MHLDQFGQARYNEVPFVGEPVAPAARFQLSIESIAHDGDNIFCVSVSVEVEIAPEVRPMIQGLDHSSLAASVLQRATNGIKKWQRMIYASTFVVNCVCRPFGNTTIAGGGHSLLQSAESPHDNVIRIGESQEIGEFAICGIG
jgi:hypothetical protein